MSDLITRTARLVPYVKRPKQVPSFVTAYSYEPMADDPGANVGNLYVVTEVLVSGRASEEVADLIIETAGDSYYNKPKSDADPLNRFESAVKAINQELSEYVNRGNASWIGKISTVIAVQVDSEVHVAQTGSAEAFLYRGHAVTHISGGSPSRAATPSKTFGSIATGKVEPGDRLLLATPALVHQVPLNKLQSIVAESSPNSSIAEITDLLKGADIDRVAALIIEITTPELAALQVRSEQPNEIQLGTPENALEAAKMAAAPITQTTVERSKKMAEAAHVSWEKVKPKARQVTLTLVDHLRQLLSTKRGQGTAIGVIICLAIVLVGLVWFSSSVGSADKQFSQYQGIYEQYSLDSQLYSQGNRSQAQSNLSADLSKVRALQHYESQINSRLMSARLLPGEPKTYAGFAEQIQYSLNQALSLSQTIPKTVVNLASNSRPNHFEIFDGDAYVFDAANNNDLTIINLKSDTKVASFANTSSLGDVISTSLSSANDGIFLFTSAPALWFYQFRTDTLTKETLTRGVWPSANAIASYSSNIYLLSGGSVYKSVRFYSGYMTPTTYIKSNSKTVDAAGLAVDGSIYVASPTGIVRYGSGSQTGFAPAIPSLATISSLRSTDNGNVIVGTDTAADRIGFWLATTSSLNFDKQVALEGVKTLYDSTYDASSGTVYATVDHQLVSFSFTP